MTRESEASDSTLLHVRGLTKDFFARALPGTKGRPFRAVNGVDIDIAPAESVALVGESGCGKTTVGRMIVGLIRPSAGIILFEGKDLIHLPTHERMSVTKRLQMIFQDPAGSLNPRLRIGDSIAEPLRAHRVGSAKEIGFRVAGLLDRVGLDSDTGKRFPHELSGGQRQRVGIARAIALSPRLVVADEPTSALDVSIRVQILNLLAELGRDLQMSFLLISHDLAVVRHYTSRLYVMSEGRIVEQGSTEQILRAPAHPYTQRLLHSVPSLDPAHKRVLAK